MVRRVHPRKRSFYQKCVARELRGRTFPNKQAARRAFKSAARKCRKLIHQKGRRGRGRRRRHARR